MSDPWAVSPEPEGPAGYTYAAVLVRADTREQVLTVLRDVRFTGWVAPPEEGWVPVVAHGAGVVATDRRGVVGVGGALAERLRATVLAVRVLHDRQLALVAWDGGEEVARYVSDPSREPGAGEDVLAEPVGAEGAEAVAAACGRPEAGDELYETLTAPLDPDEEIESERLGRALHLLELPSWLVTAWRLPRAMAIGPAPSTLVRLGAGRTGALGRLTGRVTHLARRWRTPPPVLVDPPRGDGEADDLGLWM